MYKKFTNLSMNSLLLNDLKAHFKFLIRSVPNMASSWRMFESQTASLGFFTFGILRIKNISNEEYYLCLIIILLPDLNVLSTFSNIFSMKLLFGSIHSSRFSKYFKNIN